MPTLPKNKYHRGKMPKPTPSTTRCARRSCAAPTGKSAAWPARSTGSPARAWRRSSLQCERRRARKGRQRSADKPATSWPRVAWSRACCRSRGLPRWTAPYCPAPRHACGRHPSGFQNWAAESRPGEASARSARSEEADAGTAPDAPRRKLELARLELRISPQ